VSVLEAARFLRAGEEMNERRVCLGNRRS
jgi:hypothetical protein